MEAVRPILVLAGLTVVALANGCQGTGGSAATAGNGPARTFGQVMVPPQSELSAEGPSAGNQTTDFEADAGPNADERAASSGREPRWLSGSKKDSAPTRTLPISTRSDALVDDDLDR
jgi:hypothetical protein